MTSLFVLIFLAALVALPISLIKPDIFSKFFNSTRKKNALIFGSILLASFILIGATNPTTSKTSSPITEEKISAAPTESANIESVKPDTITITLAPTATLTPTPTIKPTSIPTSTPVPTKKVIYYSPTPAAASVPINYSTPTSQPAVQNSGYGCNCSKTCTQISSCDEAQYQLNSCGCGARDGDDDGIACDSAPLNCQN